MERVSGLRIGHLYRARVCGGPGLCLRCAMASLVALTLSGCASIWGLHGDQAPPRSRLDPQLTFSTFEAHLTVSQTLDYDLQALAERLVEEWLARFTRPDVHRRYKLVDYQVHQVVIAEADPVSEVWQLRTTFSVQPVKTSLNQSAWLAGNGTYERGWIERKTLSMRMVRAENGDLVLTCVGTGP